MRTAQIVLWLATLMLVVFGLWLMVDPTPLDDWIGVTFSSNGGKTELRAFYGGLEVGLGVWCAICATRPAWRAVACLAIGLVFGGVVVARMLGIALDDSATTTVLAALAFEAAFAIAAFVGYRAAMRADTIAA